MWQRFKRWMRSLFGGALDSLENPELVLQQNIRDMNDQVPRMNESLAMIKANATLLENKQRDRMDKIERLKAGIKAALQAGRRDIALNYTTNLQQLSQEMAADEAQLKMSREAFEKALKVKEVFLQEKRRKIDEVQRAIAQHKQAQWEKRVADAMESFNVGGIDQTHNEMIDRINRESAMHQARLEMALGNIDAAGMEIEKDAQKLQANELLKQFEIELGLASPQPVEQKTLGPSEQAPAETEAETAGGDQVKKTVGPKKITNP